MSSLYAGLGLSFLILTIATIVFIPGSAVLFGGIGFPSATGLYGLAVATPSA